MNRDQARNILESCRPDNKADLADPLFAEALAWLEQDAELRRWWEDTRAIDRRISLELSRLEPPATLATEILAGMRAHGNAAGEAGAEIRFPAAVRTAPRRWQWIGIAASVALAAGLFLILTGHRPISGSSSDYAQAGVPGLIAFLDDKLNDREFAFEKRHNEAETLIIFLTRKGVPVPDDLPDDLAAMPSLGCLRLVFDEHPLSMICFRAENGQLFHLITANYAHFKEIDCRQPQDYALDDTVHHAWIEGDDLIILSGHGTLEELNSVF